MPDTYACTRVSAIGACLDDIAAYLYGHGLTLAAMDRREEACAELREAYGIIDAARGSGHRFAIAIARDLAEIYERSGRIRDRHGSVTMVPVVSMVADTATGIRQPASAKASTTVRRPRRGR